MGSAVGLPTFFNISYFAEDRKLWNDKRVSKQRQNLNFYHHGYFQYWYIATPLILWFSFYVFFCNALSVSVFLFSLLSLLDVNLLDRRSSITMWRSGCSLTVATKMNTDRPTRERETDICWFLNMHWCISSCHRKAFPPGNNKNKIGRCIFFIEQLCGCVYNLKGNKAYCVADCCLRRLNWRWGERGRCELKLLNSDYQNISLPYYTLLWLEKVEQRFEMRL